MRFFPQRYARTYVDWLAEKRDWCISRQLWWGHRIPVWSQPAGTGTDRLAALRDFGAELTVDGEVVLPSELCDKLVVRLAPGLQSGRELILCCVDAGCEDLERRLEAAGFVQDEDVLDTWFSSALWPHATLGWPDRQHDPPMISQAESVSADGNRVLSYFYPGSVLVTSRDIITLWVARMVLTGLYNMGDVPFRHVYIHPKILDGLGQTMSKSKGNGVDPLELIEKYGTDAVRFTIASLCGETQDVRLPVGYECPHCQTVTPQTKEHQELKPLGGPNPSIQCSRCKKSFQFPSPWFTADPGAPVARIVSERFDYGRNFCNKLWNACRFAFMNLEGYEAAAVGEQQLQVEDRWILSRLATTVRDVTLMLERYQFDQATRAVREFTWNEFCDWYLEMLKPRFRSAEQRAVAQRCLVVVVDSLLRLLHPFAPFITEELWHKLNELAPLRGLSEPVSAGSSVMMASWPQLQPERIDEVLERRFERLQQTIAAVRNVRSVYGISPTAQLKLFMKCDPAVAEQLQAVSAQFDFLARTMLEAAGLDISRPKGSAGFSLGDAEGYIPLEGLIDRDAELTRQGREAEKLRGFIRGHESKLSNPGFLAKAPEKVVAEIRETLENLRLQLAAAERIIADLS